MASLTLRVRRSGNLFTPGKNELVKALVRKVGVPRVDVDGAKDYESPVPVYRPPATPKTYSFRFAVDNPASSTHLEEVEERIAAFAKRGRNGEQGTGAAAAVYIEDMVRSGGLAPKDVAFVSLQALKMFARCLLAEEFGALATKVKAAGFVESHLSEFYGAHMDLHGALGNVEIAAALLDRIPRRGVALVSAHYASYFTACGKQYDEEAAFAALRKMRKRGIPFDFCSAVALLRCCTTLKRGLRVVGMMRSAGLDANCISVYTTLALIAKTSGQGALGLVILQAAREDPLCFFFDTIAVNLYLTLTLSCSTHRAALLRALRVYSKATSVPDGTTYARVAQVCGALSRADGDASDRARKAALALERMVAHS
eukprot:TRINITY_DN16971_c0_g1_i1.p1 TRINITY_DN16971_c0_g1~~TRINITY_DN16971_c0_g1_i1.p1  ORF type:complete len:370 (+),score=95.40 TRINITY_DN16971_c0_g1_i1:80-1189(+)